MGYFPTNLALYYWSRARITEDRGFQIKFEAICACIVCSKYREREGRNKLTCGTFTCQEQVAALKVRVKLVQVVQEGEELRTDIFLCREVFAFCVRVAESSVDRLI